MIRNSALEPETDEKPGVVSPVPRRRVLVADDHSRILNAVNELLRGSFDVISLTSDGPAALEAALKLAPDVIVLDISMPGMSGIEVARELRKRANVAKIVFLDRARGCGDPGEMSRGRRPGICGESVDAK